MSGTGGRGLIINIPSVILSVIMLAFVVGVLIKFGLWDAFVAPGWDFLIQALASAGNDLSRLLS